MYSFYFLPLFMIFACFADAQDKFLTRVVCDKNQDFYKLGSVRLFQKYPEYREISKSFNSKEKKRVEQQESLFVHKHEVVVTGPNDNSVTILGSDGLTAGNIIAILRHTGSKATGVGYFSDSMTYLGVEMLVNKVKALSTKFEGRYELSLIGGTDDCFSESLFKDIFDAFTMEKFPYTLVMANIGKLNTQYKDGESWPAVYGAGVNVKTGEIFPVESFSFKGPELALRASRYFTDNFSFINIYNEDEEKVDLAPLDFKYFELDDDKTNEFQTMSDSEISEWLSKNPLIEPQDFVPQLRQAYQFLVDYPSSSVFENQNHIIYKRNNVGDWAKFQA